MGDGDGDGTAEMAHSGLSFNGFEMIIWIMDGVVIGMGWDKT